MKGFLVTLLALVATPALAQVGEIAARSPYAGSLAGRAATEIQQGSAEAAAPEAVEPGVTFCRLPTSAVSGAPPAAANIDGMSTSSHYRTPR